MTHVYLVLLSSTLQLTSYLNFKDTIVCTDKRDVPSAVLIYPSVYADFDTIPESAPSCKVPQSKDCGTSRENAARSKKAPRYASRPNPEANYKSVAHFLSKSGALILISVVFF